MERDASQKPSEETTSVKRRKFVKAEDDTFSAEKVSFAVLVGAKRKEFCA